MDSIQFPLNIQNLSVKNRHRAHIVLSILDADMSVIFLILRQLKIVLLTFEGDFAVGDIGLVVRKKHPAMVLGV